MTSRGSRAWTATAVALLAVGCGPKLDVKTDWSPTADFASLSTYAWAPAPPSPPPGLPPPPALPGVDVPVDDDLLDGRIRRAVSANLAAKGFRAVGLATAPDFLVAYRTTRRNDVDVRSVPTGIGPFGALGASPEIHEEQIGTLVIEMLGRDRSAVLWRGTGEADMKRNDASTSPERDREVTDAVDQILRNFPPPTN